MIIEAKNIKKEYRRGKNTFCAVNDVSFSVDSGDFVCISGRSGSGKSTFLSILAGLLPPSSGSVFFQGKEYSRLPDDELSRLRNEHIGYIMQGQNVLPNFTVLQNVVLPYYFDERNGNPSEKAGELLERMGIAPLAAQYPSELSGGELRRVAIARALLNDPGVLIADEPTGDLDPDTAGAIMKLFAGIAQKGTAIVLVTHDADTAVYGNRRYGMSGGVLSAHTGQ
jgi:putative ABC transport system ATP-binding protein